MTIGIPACIVTC